MVSPVYVVNVVFARFLSCKVAVSPIYTLFFESELQSLASSQGKN